MFDQFLPYWQNETSGKLQLAVKRYFDFALGEYPNPLTNSELVLLKSYLKFWIDYPWQGLGSDLDYLRAEFVEASNYEQLQACIEDAVELGIDPF